ncbi:MAG: hypothetical protein NVS2B15_03020 [Pseudarthrobacter sp.]
MVGQVKHLGEGRHLRARGGLLAGELGQRLGAAIQAADLVEGEVLDVFTYVGVGRVTRGDGGGVVALLATDLPVVRDDLAAVLGDLQVHFPGC